MKLYLQRTLITAGLCLLSALSANAQQWSDAQSTRMPEARNTTPQTAASGIITTVAGNGYVGFDGNGGPATKAHLIFPQSVAVDAAGNLYIADPVINTVRKVTASSK